MSGTKDVCKDVRIGKILIQTNVVTGEPELYYLKLPENIKNYRIILMDSAVATGAAALMAIRVLMDHDVPEENITLGIIHKPCWEFFHYRILILVCHSPVYCLLNRLDVFVEIQS